MDALMANWGWMDRTIAVAILLIIAIAPFEIVAKLNRIIALLEQIARKD